MALKLSIHRLTKLEGPGLVKAFCDVIVADILMIKSLRVLEGQTGLFVAMPREQGRDGRAYDCVIPMSEGVRQDIERAIVRAYEAAP